MALINLNTTDYAWNHGHAPRGQGRWAFQVKGEDELRWYKGAFSRVRKQLERDLKREGLPKDTEVLTIS